MKGLKRKTKQNLYFPQV